MRPIKYKTPEEKREANRQASIRFREKHPDYHRLIMAQKRKKQTVVRPSENEEISSKIENS
jgi:hypothetical protein